MAHSTAISAAAADALADGRRPRHAALVRVTHWLTALCFFALLVSGWEIVISHPHFYWGEDGNVLTPALFQLPLPASRRYVKTGYNFVMPDQNGWSRALHFQSAWLVLFTALAYGAYGFLSGHFRKNLLPRDWRSLRQSWTSHLRGQGPADARSYNPLQRLAYLSVVFGLFPLMIWTGLAMSPAVTSALPVVVTALGGQQSARTIHFVVTLLLMLFVAGHVWMVYRAGFSSRVRAMIGGGND